MDFVPCLLEPLKKLKNLSLVTLTYDRFADKTLVFFNIELLTFSYYRFYRLSHTIHN